MTTGGRGKINPNPNAGSFLSFGSCPARGNFRLSASGYKVNRALLATLSPYITRHIKRYGDYMVDLSRIPPPWEGAITLPIEIPES